ncbi:MAG: S8 family serine peptidase, partial [Ilumatobacteraceae bacterium]
VAVKLPANKVTALLALPNVAAVQVDELHHLNTDSSTTFIGAPTIWAQDGGQALAGNGVIFGDLDTGVWPEHPSFADNPALGNPPPKADGTPRTCNFGDDPLTPQPDVFVCNHKLVGGQPFLDTYNSQYSTEIYPSSARDSNGHGTHTASTAAGDIVASAPIFGVNRGPISGVAPGAWIIEYKVCGLNGCFGSDSVAAVQQAILDGVTVINFSIGGGSNPYTDPVELAFLDAYDAGVLVSASAGNSGPGAATTEHVSPWTITVAASTQRRAFDSTLTVTAGTESATFVGSSIMSGLATPTPIVLAQNIPGYDALCSTELPAGAAAGRIVACKRGVIGRVQKGYNVAQGGAAGMILYNLPLADTETDNHFLPALHIADGTAFLAFMAAHPVASGSFTPGVKAVGQGDVMASFSSRGPGGQFLKPDITAPGVQILAGNTPTPDEVSGGPAGQYFQAIAGTSMSSPHIAGSAILLKSLHPDWNPGAIKSALMTTATTNVVKEDLVTPADPFDFGSGRVDLTQAGAAPVVFEDSALRMASLGNDPITALDVNVPSINVPTMPGTVRVTRTARNVSGRPYVFFASSTAPAGSHITVTPAVGVIRAGGTQTFQVNVTSSAPAGQYFGAVQLTSFRGPAVHLPVAFFNQQGAVTLAQSCAATTVQLRRSTTCTVTATNDSFSESTVNLVSNVSSGLTITAATGATVSRRGDSATADPATLAAKSDAIPAIALATDTPGGGYLPLNLFGITPTPVGDEDILNYSVPGFVLGGKTYTSIGVVSNGYLVLGGGTSTDVAFMPQTFPDPSRPNGVLAPYWSDLDGTGSPGVSVASLTDGTNSWVVVQWEVHLYGDTTAAGARSMQVWLGTSDTEDVSYEYGPDALGQLAPLAAGLTIGVENESGTAGAQISGAPSGSYRITTTPGGPGGSVTYSLTIRGDRAGQWSLRSSMTADIVPGKTVVSTGIVVSRR